MKHILSGQPRTTVHEHATVAQARECQALADNPYDPDNEAQREWEDAYYGGPVATLADAHSQWHAIHGKYAVCDLDCGASEALYADHDYEAADAADSAQYANLPPVWSH